MGLEGEGGEGEAVYGDGKEIWTGSVHTLSLTFVNKIVLELEQMIQFEMLNFLYFTILLFTDILMDY